MSPTDLRHGTPAGYQTHWRDGEEACDACAVAKFRYGKQNRFENAKGVRMAYTADELTAVLAPWVNMGLSPTAVATAAGLDGQRSAHFAKTVANGTTVRRGTYLALRALTEDDFSPNAKVYADLTRRRIFSLMAIGHRLVDMPINNKGQWRYRSHVNVETARLIRAHYRANEFRLGPCRYTQARARNAGHGTPLSWDDPGTLAWPNGVPAAQSNVKDINSGGGLPWPELLAEYAFLTEQCGFTKADAVRRLGVTEDAIRNAEKKRAKAEESAA